MQLNIPGSLETLSMLRVNLSRIKNLPHPPPPLSPHLSIRLFISIFISFLPWLNGGGREGAGRGMRVIMLRVNEERRDRVSREENEWGYVQL